MKQSAQSIPSIIRVNSSIEEPLISVVVPVYNTQDYLLETLQSLSPQTGRNLEIIIINDGSTDDSDLLIRNWITNTKIDTTYIVQQNQGLSLARMNGTALARGRYLAFCDSDDLLDINTIITLAEMMSDRNVDVGLFRSCVFENTSGISYDFYDSNIWEELLNGNSHLLTTPQRNPTLFRLEPNANTRVFRREFFETVPITFPSRLHFEDLPAHIESLAAAQSILLINKTGYYYRVNRPGKITDQKSDKRFDILESARLALNILSRRNMPTPIQAWTMLLASRMIYWCGKNTLNKDRSRFYRDACNLLSAPEAKLAISHAIKNCGTTRERFLLILFAANSHEFLARHASGTPPRLRDGIRTLVRSRHRIDALRIVYSASLQKIKSRTRNLLKSHQ